MSQTAHRATATRLRLECCPTCWLKVSVHANRHTGRDRRVGDLYESYLRGFALCSMRYARFPTSRTPGIGICMLDRRALCVERVEGQEVSSLHAKAEDGLAVAMPGLYQYRACLGECILDHRYKFQSLTSARSCKSLVAALAESRSHRFFRVFMHHNDRAQ